jgi:hypothetical protein
VTVQSVSVASTRGAVWGWVCLVAGILGFASAILLIVVDPAVGEDRFSYPLASSGFVAIQVFFFVHHFGLLAGLYGLWRSGAIGPSRPGQWGAWGAIAGMALLAVVELAAISGADSTHPSDRTDMIESLYGVPTVLIGVALIVAGIAVIRAGQWQGWRRFLPLALGAWVFVPMTPALFGPFVFARLAIGVWMLGFAALGWALVETETASDNRGDRESDPLGTAPGIA